MPVRATMQHLRHLGREDQDGQGVDEAGADGAGHEAHQHIEPKQTKDDLQRAGENGGDQKVVEAMSPHEGSSDERDGAGGTGDHGGAAAGDRNHDADDEGGEQADFRIDARDEGKGDDFGDEGKGADHAGEHFAPEVTDIGEPLGAIAGEGR